MDRNNRDARRATAMSASINPSFSNALPRRRHRTTLRETLEEDVPLELPDTSRSGLRERHVGGKKDRERSDRVDRDRERLLRNKRRRGDGNSNNHRLIHHGGTGNRGEELGVVADESSEESVNDNEDEDDYEHLHHQQHTRLLQPASDVTSSASMMLNNSRRSYPPSASALAAAAGAPLKVNRPAWKAADEMIGVSVPRKARSASAKRSHDCWVGGGTTVSHASGDQAARQSPVGPGPVVASPVNNRPASPSSSNASAHKKLKPNGPKQRPPSKSVSKPVSSSATQDEIEIAEVLYGMMRQPQAPSSKSESSFGGESVKTEAWRDENNKPGSVLPLQNSGSSIPLTSAVAPKRKKPRAVKYDEEIQTQSTYPSRNDTMAAKIEVGSTMKIDPSPSMERGRGSGMVVNGGTYEPGKPRDTPVPLTNHGEDASKMEVGLPGLNKRDGPGDSKQESHSLKMECEGNTEPRRSTGAPEAENQRVEKFQIDLMAPPQTRSSPGRDGHGDSPAGADQISNGTAGEEGEKRTEAKKNKEGGGVNAGKVEEEEDEVVMRRREAEVDGKKSAGGGGDSKGMVDLQIDMESSGGGGMMMMMMGNGNGSGSAGVVSKRNHTPFPKQQQHAADKSAPPAGPLTFPIPVAGWPGGLPPMGYIPPLPGVVSVDGSAVTSAALQPPPLLFSNPRPKRCATHCYIARNISYHQQMARIPFWPTAAAAAAGPMSLYGAKPCHVNVMPSADPNGNVSTRSVNAVAEKGQNLGLPCHSGKDKGSQTSSEAQKKPVLLQQSIPPGAPSNILHGPAFIFPLSQQHATANTVRSGSSKSPNVSNAAVAAGAAASSVGSSAVAPTGAATAMSFSYPNMPGSESEYLAILQNNSYPFPVPTLMGAAPAYRGTHPQAMPFFNGPFFSSQMLHPSQLPQQVPANLAQLQGQGHQNPTGSSMKHMQNLQKPSGTVSNGSSGSLQGFASGKIQPSPQTLMQQPQIDQQQTQQVRPSESEFAGGDSHLTPDARIPRTSMTTIYGQNFAMPIHAPNFALMTQAPQGSVTGANSNNTGEKKQQPQLNSQHQGSKQYAVDSLQSQAFALSFGNIGNSASALALDISSIAQGHAVLQSLPEATSHTYQMIAAAVAAQNTPQKKNIRPTDDGCKGGGNDASNDYERKPVGGKSLTTGGQSITFSRPDMMDTSVSSLTGSSVGDSFVRTLNLGSSSSRASVSVMPAQASTNPGSPSPQQVQRSQQQQMIQLQKQHQFAAAAAAAARSKTPASSNGSVYSEHLGASASAGAKYPSSLSMFPQNFVQGSGSPAQSPQWRGSPRPAISPMPSPLSPATATSQSLKHLSQQPVQRVPPGQTHISFANSNSKSSNPSQGQQVAVSSQQSPSSPAVVGSPTTSSVSKSTGGSPRTTTSSTGNKPIQGASSLQAHQAKSSIQSMPMHKSSPVGSGNVSSILGNSPQTASTGAGSKHQLPQQQLSKQNLQQAQLFFSHPYVPVPAGQPTMNPTSTASATNAYYMQRRPSEQQPKAQHPTRGSGPSSSSATLSLCPPTTVSSPGSCDPIKAVAVSNLKGSNLQSQGILHAAPFTVTQSSGGSHQIVQAGFSYVHAVPNAVKVKQAEQKPPAGE